MKTTVHGPLEFDVLADGVGFPEGPVISEDGTVHVVDIDGGVIWRLDDGGPTVVARPGAGPNGMAPETATTVLVANKRGLHARAAAKFVTLAERFGSSVEVVRGDDPPVSARSIMGLMMLGAGKGCPLELRAEGWDAKEALEALTALVEAGFDERD